MSTEKVKKFLEEETGVPAKNWSRLSKSKLPDGSELRIFVNKLTGETKAVKELKYGALMFHDVGENTTASLGASKSMAKRERDAAIQHIHEFTQSGRLPNPKDSGYAIIPSLFKFSFLEDANDDYLDEIEALVDEGTYASNVGGINIFISPVDDVGIQSCLHYGPLLKPYISFEHSEVQEATFEIEEEISFQGVFEALKSKGFIYDIGVCMLRDFVTEMTEENYYEKSFEVEKENGFYYLIADSIKWGPYNSVDAVAKDVQDLELNVIHTPEFLCFDAKKEDGRIMIYVASLLDPECDNLGSHNVSSLPFDLEAEDMECTWSVDESIGVSAVKKAMKECGFTYCQMLN